MKDRRMEGRTHGKVMLLSQILTIRGSNIHCNKFGWIPPSSLGGDSLTDRWTDAQADGRTEK